MPTVPKNEDKVYTIEEYLALEDKAEHKSEYYNGIVWAMSGGSLNHSVIANNTTGTIRSDLKEKRKNCRVTNSDMKVKVEKSNSIFYPDGMVICGKPEYGENRTDMVKNPILIIEVLSPSTENFDRGKKFQKYRTIPSFKEYVLISQKQAKVEVWYKEEVDLWRISHAYGLEGVVEFRSIDCEIFLADIYYMIDDLEDVQMEFDF